MMKKSEMVAKMAEVESEKPESSEMQRCITVICRGSNCDEMAAEKMCQQILAEEDD